MSTDACRLACIAASQTVEETFAGRIPLTALRALVETAGRADEMVNPETLAVRCGRSRRTLCRRLREVGLPSPESLIAWGRILVASALLSDGDKSLEDVALDLGLDGSGALVHLYRRHLGLTPGEVRRRGGLAVVASLLSERTTAPPRLPRSMGKALRRN